MSPHLPSSSSPSPSLLHGRSPSERSSIPPRHHHPPGRSIPTSSTGRYTYLAPEETPMHGHDEMLMVDAHELDVEGVTPSTTTTTNFAATSSTTTTTTTSNTATLRTVPPPPPSIQMLSYAPLLHGLVQLQSRMMSSSSTNQCNTNHNSKTTSLPSTGTGKDYDTDVSTTTTTTATRHAAVRWIIHTWRRKQPPKPRRGPMLHTNITTTATTTSTDGGMDQESTKKRARPSNHTNCSSSSSTAALLSSTVPSFSVEPRLKRTKWNPTEDQETSMWRHHHHLLHHDPPQDWVWNMLQSYANQERWYATKLLMQQFLTTTTTWNVDHERFAFLRRLVASIHPCIHNIDTGDHDILTDGRRTTSVWRQPSHQRLPNLTEWCTTFQFVLSHHRHDSLPTAASATDGSIDTTVVTPPLPKYHFDEMMAIVYHYWPWFCETLWKLVTTTTVMELWSHQPHLLAWIQMLYTFTIAAVSSNHDDEDDADNEENNALLPAMKLLNRFCLWNTKWLVASETTSTVGTDPPADRTMKSVRTPSLSPPRHGSVVTVSPLAHLIATYFRIKDSRNCGKAILEAQQLLREMIHYRTTVRMMIRTKHPYSKNTTQGTTKTSSKDDATSSSIKTTKACNATTTTTATHPNLNDSTTTTGSTDEKEVAIRFADDGDEEDDDDDDNEKDDTTEDHPVDVPHRENKERVDDHYVLDHLQSIILQSDHSSHNSSHHSDHEDEDSQDDDHTFTYENDNDTVSSQPPKKNSDDYAAVAINDVTTTHTNDPTEKNDTTAPTVSGGRAKQSETSNAVNDHPTTTAKTITTGTRRPSSDFATIVFGEMDQNMAIDDANTKENDDHDDDDPMPDDDDDDFVEDNDDDDDDEDDDDNDVMDYAFIRDDSFHRYRTALEQHDKPDDDAEDGHDTSEDQILSGRANATNEAGATSNSTGTGTTGSNSTSSESENSLFMIERRKIYILASMQVLSLQHPQPEAKVLCSSATATTVDQENAAALSTKYLSVASENELIGSINAAVKPPTKPIVTKIVLRRAPTQEEFFRGSLTRNPVPVSMLLNHSRQNNRSSATNDAKNSDDTISSDREATIYDLRQYIANDLQMADSAELIEIVVANKILDVNLKIRVVQQVLWKKSLMENSNISRDQHRESTFGALLASSGGAEFFTSGSTMSFLLSNSAGNTNSSHSRNGATRVTADTPLAQLPPMIATYRLAGVDGEATEETVGASDLIDPEAVSDTASPEEQDALLEAEFGMTRYVTAGHGAEPLLRSTQDYVSDVLRRIRRDDIGGHGLPNTARLELKQSPPCQALILLRYCTKLAINRKRMLEARAPTILLALLIDILKTLEETSASAISSSLTVNDSNSTAEILQELIELLTSDISSVGSDNSSSRRNISKPNEDDVDMFETSLHNAKDASSMSLLLQSIETIALSSPLRIVVAKLLPFLTYGQPDLCRELALHFDKHINNETLIDWEISSSSNDDAKYDEGTKNSIMTNTFIQTALVLPANDVCDSLRTELINCRFIESIITFITQDIPSNPAPWTPTLWAVVAVSEPKSLESWRNYYSRPGVRTAFKVLNGLCRHHGPTQSRIALQAYFIKVCHWLESTSDSLSVSTNGLGLLAETLLDEIILGNDEVGRAVKSVRNTTRLRKKELAQEQRNRAIQRITSFGGMNNIDTSKKPMKTQFASILAPVVELFQSKTDSIVPSSIGAGEESSPSKTMPSWFAEVEDIQDEFGLTCAVCQEGCTLQPSELLGLYVYIKKISLSIDLGGSCSVIDGTNLLEALPSTLPDSLLDHPQNAMISEWFATTQSVVVNVLSNNSSKSSNSTRHRQHVSYTTSVTAGNGIHFSCHRRARQADRSHPKAPKTEWEGATLRNSRVSCNAILPVVHGPNQSKIPLVALESALSDHSEIVSNISGSSSPKSALWLVLHDLRLLLLRISHNESLSTDCGGGSLASNCQLIYHQIYLARLRERNAAMIRYDHQTEHSMHARGLAAAVLLATAVINSDKIKSTSSDVGSPPPNVSVLTRHLADAAPMGALASVVFPRDENGTNSPPAPCTDVKGSIQHWNVGHDYFLQSLVICAGKRHACGVTGSGCTLSSGQSIDEEVDDDDDDEDDEDNDTEQELEDDNNTENVCYAHSTNNVNIEMRHSSRAPRRSDEKATLRCDDYMAQLRPLLTFYIILNQIHKDLTVGPLSDCNDDIRNDQEQSRTNTSTDPIEACVEQLVHLITFCWKCRSVKALLSKLPKSSNNSDCIETNVLGWFQQGMMSS